VSIATQFGGLDDVFALRVRRNQYLGRVPGAEFSVWATADRRARTGLVSDDLMAVYNATTSSIAQLITCRIDVGITSAKVDSGFFRLCSRFWILETNTKRSCIRFDDDAFSRQTRPHTLMHARTHARTQTVVW